MNQKPEIAIIEPNTLTALGLKSILEKIIPMAVIRTFHNFGELVDDTPDMYAHYFIAAQIYVEHNTFFLPRKKKTIVLAGESQPFQLVNVPVICRTDTEHLPTGRIIGQRYSETPPTCPSRRISGGSRTSGANRRTRIIRTRN